MKGRKHKIWIATIIFAGGLLGMAIWHRLIESSPVASSGTHSQTVSKPEEGTIAEKPVASSTLSATVSQVAAAAGTGGGTQSLAVRRRGEAPTDQERKWTAEAAPSPKTSMLLLDLSKPPSEKDLRQSGQLGEELQPIGPADPAAIVDLTARRRLEAINLDFGRAIQEWNKHNYDLAQDLFLKHLAAYPDSPWAAESELHLGCACQYLGKLDEAQKFFEAAQSRAPAGDPMTAKGTLRLGALAMDQGALDRAFRLFVLLKATADTPAHATYASYWIRALSLMKAMKTSMRDCGQKSLGEICAVLGKDEDARALRSLPASGADGFNMQELEQLARRHGLEAYTVLAQKHRLSDLPVPYIVHYQKDQHFVAVLGRESRDGKVRIYDTRVGHTLDVEASYVNSHWSGYALVFSSLNVVGVRVASVQEKMAMFGGCCGMPRYPDDLGPDCDSQGCGGCRGMPGWNVNPKNMNLVVSDTPMWWDAPYGPSVSFNLTYNSLDSLISLRPFGDKWTWNYGEFAIVDPSGTVMIIRSTGKAERYVPNTINGGYNPDAHVASSKLTRLDTYVFELEESDGTKYRYAPPVAGSVASLLTRITDKYGTAITIGHNAQGAVTSVSHPAAGTWNLIYNPSGKVARITDPFGREATFTYDQSGQKLVKQTDMGGVEYGYGYTNAAIAVDPDPNIPGRSITRSSELFLNSLITPMGATLFYTEPSDGLLSVGNYPAPNGHMWFTYRITITDPLGFQEEYFYQGYYAGWHRDKNFYKPGVPAYGGQSSALTQPATHYHYILANGRAEISSIENQGGGTTVFSSFNSGGSPGLITPPDNRSEQYTYNDKGNILTQVTADGIIYTYEYAANGLDVVRTKRKSDNAEVILSQTSYNPTSRDVTSTTDQAGRATTYLRNARGQLTSVTDARGNVTSYQYEAQGRLQTVKYKPAVRANPITQGSFVYDNIGRLAAQADVRGYSLLFEYDDLNRVVKTTYPDLTTVVNEYDCCTLHSTKARDGSITLYGYDALKRLVSVIAPGPHGLNYTYDKVGNLTKLQFGRGESVRWEYDSGNRVVGKVYPDGTGPAFSYDPVTGRLLSSTDAQNRITTFGYEGSGRLKTVTAPGLPAQTYIYDSLGRLASQMDGAGASTRVTTYSYDNLDRLTRVQLPADEGAVAYFYDQWGRRDHWTYGATDETPGTESYTYDDLDRVATVTNPLGSFALYHDGDTGTVTRLNYPVAGLYTQYARLGVNQDQRLSQIVHQGAAGELARFDFEYDGSGGINKWSASQAGMTAPRQWRIGYDPAHQMTSVEETPRGAAGDALPQSVWRYAYDASGNRAAAQEGGRTTTGVYNDLNQLTQLVASGATWFRGKVNKAAQVTVSGQAAKVSADGIFEAIVSLGPGQHDVPIHATDRAGNVTNEIWRVDNGSDAPRTCTYDASGNMLADGQRGYTWDARNRLASLSKGADTWTYQYNGADFRRVETKNGALQRTWVWQGTTLRESREQTSGVRYRFWSYGAEVLNSGHSQSGRRYLLRDHLGSVRVVADQTGGVQASYDYNAWGKRTKLTGSADWPQGYSGYWEDEAGLVYYGYRYYAPELGRWASRDPIGEDGGDNLYCFVLDNPVQSRDSFGLAPESWKCCDAATITAGEKTLTDRYNAAYAKLTGVKRNLTNNSCYNINGGIILPALAPIPKCWVCDIFHKTQDPSGHSVSGSGYYDQWSIICKAHDKSGAVIKVITFDAWNSRPAGEAPGAWLSKQYPYWDVLQDRFWPVRLRCP